jgi:hypothetical protein
MSFITPGGLCNQVVFAVCGSQVVRKTSQLQETSWLQSFPPTPLKNVVTVTGNLAEPSWRSVILSVQRAACSPLHREFKVNSGHTVNPRKIAMLAPTAGRVFVYVSGTVSLARWWQSVWTLRLLVFSREIRDNRVEVLDIYTEKFWIYDHRPGVSLGLGQCLRTIGQCKTHLKLRWDACMVLWSPRCAQLSGSRKILDWAGVVVLPDMRGTESSKGCWWWWITETKMDQTNDPSASPPECWITGVHHQTWLHFVFL